MGKIIGIDLGTTNSVVAVMEGSEPTVIANREGNRITPSVVAFTKDGERLVGQIARRQAVTNPGQNGLFDQNASWDAASTKSPKKAAWCPTRCRRPATATRASRLTTREFAPPEISAMVLQRLKEAAEELPGRESHRGRHHHPRLLQRQPAAGYQGRWPDRRAGRQAHHQRTHRRGPGIRPRQKKTDETIAVYDFGGGTFDISILDVGDNVVEVKATNGDTHLGGDNFDQRIIDWLVDEFKRDQGIDLERRPHGHAAPQGSRRKGQVRAVLGGRNRDQPAFRHR